MQLGAKNVLLHRLVYLAFHGTLPQYLDHKNRNKLDNRLRNLRPITFAANMRNATGARNPSGYRNITLDPSKCWAPYQVRVSIDKKLHHLGGYKTLRRAIIVRNKFRRKHGLPI